MHANIDLLFSTLVVNETVNLNSKLKKAKIVSSEHMANVTGHRGINFLNDYAEADEEKRR